MTLAYRPPFQGAHAQTIGGQIVRTFLRWPFPSEDVVIEARPKPARDDPESAGVQLLVRASWQPGASERPALVLVHGLEGSADAPYVVSTGVLAHRLGWHVVRMNMRGCGESLAVCPRLYNAGLSGDLLAVAGWLSERVSRFAVCGFSLGAGLTLLTLSRERAHLPEAFRAGVAVCPPLDMARAADALEAPGNWLYSRRFTSALCRSYRERQALAPERYERDREKDVASVRQFDDVITAHYGGYRDADHYYHTVSTGPKLAGIDRPTLVLSSANDPFIPRASTAHWPRAESVSFECVEGAGHVGFVARSRAPRRFWAADRVLQFLQQVDGLKVDS